MVEGKLLISEIQLKPTVVISDERFMDKAVRIVKKAKDACLISNSVQSKITMEITVEVKHLLLQTE
jgi:organic hydroperoxide reductase OsmC/OhrA